MGKTEQWIEYLQHPLVLVGFALFIVASVVYLLKPAKLSGAATERLFARGLGYVFILSLFVITAGTYISLSGKTDNPKNQDALHTQQSHSNKSPVANSGSNTNISDDVNAERSEKPFASTPKTATIPLQATEQNTRGDKSPAINSQGDVNINYGQ